MPNKKSLDQLNFKTADTSFKMHIITVVMVILLASLMITGVLIHYWVEEKQIEQQFQNQIK